MRTQSGCFGSAKQGTADVIDTLEEVSATVDDIVQTDGTSATAVACTAATLMASMERRIRLLTWAVAAIALVLVLKEVKE